MVRVVSLNAWGGQCWDALADWVPEVRADVLCLQEVIRAPVPSPAWLTYRDPYRTLDQRADLFGDVATLLPDHQSRFAAAARGVLQDEAGQAYLSEHGLAVWVAPELAVVGAWQGFVHGSFRHDGWGEEPVPRAAQVLRLATPDGQPFVVAHLHGLRDPAGKGDTPARRLQWQATVRALDQVAEPGDPIILGGDFNVLPDSEAFALFADIGLRDLISAHGVTDTRTSLYRKPQRYADYMLVNAAVQVIDFQVPALPEVSDHRPLILEFEPAATPTI
ncbi:MAG: endonuclease/exonuclease/phosphatase family protein [Pseudomonadota bacterium]